MEKAAMIDSQKYGPWAIVVGGSEGLGACFASRIAEAGINVVIVARKEGPLHDVAEKIRAEYGVQVRTLSLDLTSDDMLDRICDVTDDVDIGLLVYNAGAAHRTGGFFDQSLDDAMRVVRLNPVGQVTLSYHFGKKMIARGRGGIILLGSIASVAGAVGVVTYSGAKAFGQIFAEGLWAEAREYGVDVLQIPLGSFKTPAMQRIGLLDGSDDFDGQVQEILANLGNGPVFVSPALAEYFREVTSMPRREAAEMMAERMRAMAGFNAPEKRIGAGS